MKLSLVWIGLAFVTVLGCSTPQIAEPPQSPQEAFMANLRGLCGKAFAGRMVTDHPNDADLKGKAMIMHVRTCDSEGVRIPLHVEADRSRTWVVTTVGTGLQLKHDHRHDDGAPDEITQYGGTTAGQGTALRQEFPADGYSKALFTRTNRPNSSLNTWAMEIVPGQKFIYEVTRPNRHVRFEFDLSRSVRPPPPPWGADFPNIVTIPPQIVANPKN
jgi:hypothetical protein